MKFHYLFAIGALSLFAATTTACTAESTDSEGDVEAEAVDEAADALHPGCVSACPGSTPPFARCAPGYVTEMCPSVPSGCYSTGIPVACPGGPTYAIVCCAQ